MELPDIVYALRKHKKLFLGVFFVFVVAALLKSYLAKPYYHFDFLVKTPNLVENEKVPLVSDVELRMMTKELTFLQRTGNYEVLSNRMNVKSQVLENIKSIQSNYEQSRDKSNLLEFSIDVYDTNQVREVKKGILNFLNNNEFVLEKLTDERNKLIALKSGMEKDLNKMDEPIQAASSGSTNSQMDLIARIMLANLVGEKAKLSQKIYETDLRIDDLQGFKIIQEPYTAERAGPYILRNVIISAILSVVISVFIIILLKLIRESKES